MYHDPLPFKWLPNLKINPPSRLRTLQMASKFNRPNARKVATFEFGITTPCLANGLQIERSKRQKCCDFRFFVHHSVPFKWPPNFEVKTPEKSHPPNFRSRLRTLQLTSKFRGQNARKVAAFEFSITTPYPSNDLQNWRSSCNIRIWDHHSLPFKGPPNLEVKTPEKMQLSNLASPLRTLQVTSKYRGQNGRQKSCSFRIFNHPCLPFKLPPNLDIKTREKLQLSNLGSRLPTLQMPFKFRDQNARKVGTFGFPITTPYPSNALQI